MGDVNKIQAVMDKSELLFDLNAIETALDTMAVAITDKLKDKNPIVLCVMIGAMLPTAYLVTRLHFPIEIDYVHATRYKGGTRGGELHWLVEPRQSLQGRTILVVDDIMDGGLTLAAIRDYCEKAGATEVLTAVMVDKIREREVGVNFEPDFSGLKVEDRYVFGFGLDYNEYLRNAPGIYVVADEHQ